MTIIMNVMTLITIKMKIKMKMMLFFAKKNDIRDVGSTADLVLVLLVYLVHWYLVHLYPLVPDST